MIGEIYAKRSVYLQISPIIRNIVVELIVIYRKQ